MTVAGVLVLFVVLVFVKMGQSSSASVCTLLQCFLKNFQDFKKRAGDYGYVNALDLQQFCEREWPTSQVRVRSHSPGSGLLLMFPRRWVRAGPPDLGLDGQPFMIYVPFSTSDLYNWKNQNPSFSQNPQGLISLLESVFFTHQPTWDDCQQLMQTVFTSEERERVKAEGRRFVLGPDGQPTSDQDRLEAVFPSRRPNWNPNSERGKEALDRYHQTLLGGIRAAARRPTNLSKVTETVQGPNESPAAFLERLCEAYRVYTPIDPDAPESQRAVIIAFVSQSAPDIRKKLQKLEGFEGKSISELVEVAQKVFNNREDRRQV
ncbi:uncharacterized protein [Myotis yumanensis]|uniref:uncharacterized protein n=1 Tax=Myotis yumanensis TaxID=159337 RepID=UPI0038D3AD92